MTERPIQLFVPAVTPFADDLSIDTDRFVANARRLLDAGAHGLAPFGTTSEATSLTLAERKSALEALIASGVAPDRLIPGTGCCAQGDTVDLSAHATALGCKGVLMLPPFFYKNVPEDGVFEAYARVIGAVGPDLRVYLYHIPQMSGVPITLTLIERLIARFGDQIAGLKDSSGDWSNTAAVIAAFPRLETYSASEAHIPDNASAGGAGCISATSNVNPAGICALIDALGTPGQVQAHDRVSAVRATFERLPLIPAVKAAIAAQTGDPGYATVRPPLRPLSDEHRAALDPALAVAG